MSFAVNWSWLSHCSLEKSLEAVQSFVQHLLVLRYPRRLVLEPPRPELRITTMVLGSMGKGLVAGFLIGWFAKKVNSLPLGIVFGLTMGALFALPFAMGTDPTTGQKYFWEILISGSMVGPVVGYLTHS